jgi:hypothetical protein
MGVERGQSKGNSSSDKGTITAMQSGEVLKNLGEELVSSYGDI